MMAAGAGVAALSLVGCGGSDNKGGGSSSSGGQEASKSVTQPVDTTKQAKKGGTLTLRRTADITHFDSLMALSNAGLGQSYYLSRIIRLKPGVMQRPGVEFIGDLAESWEFSPDHLTMTLKLRPNSSWHNIAPVNGRKVDGEDIAATWKRWEGGGTNRGSYASKINPSAPIDTMTATDARTVTVKLSQPVSSVLGILATNAGGMFCTPKEAIDGYDPRKVAIGSGPWAVENYQPSVKVDLKRHDGHHEADRIYIDKLTEIILPEYAAMTAQFKTGSIFSTGADIRISDIPTLKGEVSDLNVYLQDPGPVYGAFNFGWNPALGAKTPFRDKRLRQAFALSIDRDLYLDAIYDLKKLGGQGYPINGYLHTAVQADTGGEIWLDPKGKDFGPNAKYYKQDVAEAKKLVAAAGLGNTEVTGTYGNFNLDVFTRTVPIVQEFLKAVGINANVKTVNYVTEFQPIHGARGDFEGFSVNPRGSAGIFDPVEIAFTEYTPSTAIAYTGFYPDGGTFQQGDPEYTSLLTKSRQEFDTKKKIAMMHDFQRLEAANQYRPNFPGVADGLGINWPALKNYNVFHGDLPYVSWWLDNTQKPFKG
jgi:peptide/nickel transport system substrate-binding protein